MRIGARQGLPGTHQRRDQEELDRVRQPGRPGRNTIRHRAAQMDNRGPQLLSGAGRLRARLHRHPAHCGRLLVVPVDPVHRRPGAAADLARVQPSNLPESADEREAGDHDSEFSARVRALL